jgi:hypothetical protein
MFRPLALNKYSVAKLFKRQRNIHSLTFTRELPNIFQIQQINSHYPFNFRETSFAWIVIIIHCQISPNLSLFLGILPPTSSNAFCKQLVCFDLFEVILNSKDSTRVCCHMQSTHWMKGLLWTDLPLCKTVSLSLKVLAQLLQLAASFQFQTEWCDEDKWP